MVKLSKAVANIERIVTLATKRHVFLKQSPIFVINIGPVISWFVFAVKTLMRTWTAKVSSHPIVNCAILGFVSFPVPAFLVSVISHFISLSLPRFFRDFDLMPPLKWPVVLTDLVCRFAGKRTKFLSNLDSTRPSLEKTSTVLTYFINHNLIIA